MTTYIQNPYIKFIETGKDSNIDELLDKFVNIAIENGSISEFIFGLFFILLLLLEEMFITSHYSSPDNPDEKEAEGKKEDKGKGKATQEEQDSWNNAPEQGYAGSGQSGDDDDDEDERTYNKKVRQAQINQDAQMANLLHNNLNNNLRKLSDSYGSESSYSIISSDFNENDDQVTANKKLDLQELDKQLKLEKILADEKAKSAETKLEAKPNLGEKRKFEDDLGESSKPNKK